MSNVTTRDDVKALAAQIENLAREVQTRADNGGELLSISNELVRSSQTFVFTLGEVYALEQAGVQKTVKARVVRNPNSNYHNVRDSRGRFTRV